MCWFLDMVLEACIWVQKHGILGRERTKQEPLWGREIGKICPPSFPEHGYAGY